MKIDEAQACATLKSPEDARAAYWLAENLDAHARETGLVAGASPRRSALCLARRAAELDPSYLWGAPLRLLGRLLVELPALSGGDAEASRKAFEEAQRLTPSCLSNQVDFAASWAVKVQDREAFEQALDAVLAATADVEGLGPENRLARARALKLKAQLHPLFR